MLFKIRYIKFCKSLISWNKVFKAYSHIILIVVRFFNQNFYYDASFLCFIFLTVEDFAGFVKNKKKHSYSIVLYVTFCHLLLHSK